MRSASIGTPAASPSRRRNPDGDRAGFTLLEALVALALLLAFAAAAAPLFHHGRRILVRGDGEVRAEILLASLLEKPVQSVEIDAGGSEGETGGFRWRMTIQPFDGDAFAAPSDPDAKTPPYDWRLYRVAARVVWADDQSVGADTLRLLRSEIE
jgi:general secretion pathway protein I